MTRSSRPDWKAKASRVWPALQPYLDQIETPDALTLATYADMTMRRRIGERARPEALRRSA